MVKASALATRWLARIRTSKHVLWLLALATATTLGWLVYQFGDDAQALWQRHAILVSLLAAVAVIAVALLMRAVAGLWF